MLLRGSEFLIALFLAQSAVDRAFRNLIHPVREPQRGGVSAFRKVPWKPSLWSPPSCTYHFSFVQTFLEPLAVWSTLLFPFLARSTIPFISVFSLECCLHLPVSLQKCRACLLLKPEVLSLQYWSKSPALSQFQNTELVFSLFFPFATLSGYSISCKMTHQSREVTAPLTSQGVSLQLPEPQGKLDFQSSSQHPLGLCQNFPLQLVFLAWVLQAAGHFFL